MPKSLISQSYIDRISELVGAGNYPGVAAQATGITDRTWRKWQKKAIDILDGMDDEDMVSSNINNTISYLEPTEALYVRLYLSVKKAEAEAECRDVSIINEGDKRSIPILAKLSRRHPDRWSDRKADEEAIAAGVAFLGKLTEALKKPQETQVIETTVIPSLAIEATKRD